MPHQDDPDGEGADCLQTRGGGRPEEKGFTEEADGSKKKNQKNETSRSVVFCSSVCTHQHYPLSC